jgi:hypothetical protein
MLDLSGLSAQVLERIPYAAPFAWKTGTVGWYAADKVTTEDGTRYQVQANAYIIGSKAAKEAKPSETLPMAALLGACHLLPHTWKTGTTGALAVGKVMVGAKKVQVQVNAFRIGSAPKLDTPKMSTPKMSAADRAGARADAREAKVEAKRSERKASAKRLRASIDGEA